MSVSAGDAAGRHPTRTLLVAVGLVGVCLLALGDLVATPVVAQSGGTIPPERCPNGPVPICDNYIPPADNLYTAIDYTIPAFQTCVRERCLCSFYPEFTEATPVTSINCAVGGDAENGATTCNELSACLTKFFLCVDTAALAIYDPASTVESAEHLLAKEIVTFANTVGAKYADSTLFASCAQETCNRASYRQNCGLLTCQPILRHVCNATIEAPASPDGTQLCTEGCVASLLLMALTLISFSYFMLCLIACPAGTRRKKKPVEEKKPAGYDEF